MTSLAPQCAAAANDADDASSSIQHINLYSNVTNNNNCKVQPTKLPVAKSRILLQRFFDKNDFIKCHNSVVVIVRMVQIVVPNDKNATALTQSVSGESVTPIEPAAQQPDNNSTNNLSMNSNNGSTSNGDAVNDTSLAASTDAMDSCPIERKANTSTASSVHTMSNKKSNVIMVKRSKLQDNSNGGVPMPVFRSMSISTPKSTENRSPLAATSVIIMNKMGQTGKNGSNLNKTEMYEMPTRTNHLLRILNSPPKPINASPLPTFGANLERTIGGATPLTDFQKALKVQTTLANEVSPLVKAETDQTKLRHLLNDQNGNKKLNNNLFICKTEGKVIRLTPLMGSTITNEVKVLPDLQQQKNICPIILEKKDGISSKSPPPLTVMSTSTTATKNSASVAGTRSVFEEIYAKFMNTKDVQKDAIVEGEKKNGAITTTTLMDVDDTKVIKSGFYSIPTSHTTIISPKQQTTFLQCQGGLVKADGFNVSPVAATFASGDGKIGAKMNTIQAAPAIYLKQMPKHRTAQSKSGLCEILVTNENDLKVLQKTGNETTTTNNLSTTATIANPAMNQIHIFPLITSSNGRNVAISSAQPRTSCIRPQVIITGTNSSDSQRMQTKIEPEKRNLVDQLREFEMVMEQIKEERNINETGDKLMLNNLSGILNQHIIDSCQMRSVGLPQKINLAIIKKATTTGKTITTQKITTTLSDTKRCTSTPVVVVTAAAAANVNASTAKTGRLTIKSPQDVTSTKLNADGTSLIQSTFENVAASVKIDSANFKAVAQQQQQQQQPSAQTQATAAAAAKHPQKSQEDEQTVQRIYDILAQYAEQISSSPDLNNKPAPRRRSNLVSIQSSPITTSGIRMVSSKSSMSSTSSTTVGSIISSSSNSNSSNESYHSATINESRKRTTSLQNDDPNGNDCASNIDTITIQQPADKKRRISNINLDGNDFILTTMPSLSTYTALPKSSTNDMLKTANNQIIITTTTTNAQQQTTNEIIPATIKQEGGSGGELLLTNVNTNLTNGKAQLSTKLKPLTIGVANSSIVESAMVKAGGDGGGAGTGQQSPAAILLPGMSVVVSTEQNLQQQQQQHGQITTKLTNSNNTSGETGARFCGFTTGFPYKINIAGANKCRPFKQCITGGQSYRNDNYILPMGFLKYKNPTTTTTTVISGEQSKINQMNQIVHPNVATVMIPSANVQRDLGGVGNNVKIISTDSVTINKDGGGLAKAQHIQFNIAKKSDNFTTIPAAATSLQSQSMATVGTAPTLLFRTLSGTNIGGIHHSLNVKKSTDDGFTTICEQLKSSSENSSNLLPTFTSIKAHQSDAQPLVESIQLPSQIFQSNRGILILDSNKYATLLTTNYTIPTTTAPVMSETKRLCLDDVKSSTSTSTSSSPLSLLSSAVMSAEPKTTAITMPITSDQSVFSTKIDMKVPICDSEDDFLNGLDSPKCGDDVNDESFDGLHQSGRIFSMHMKTLPSLFGGEYSKSCDDILDPNNHNHDDDDVDGIDDAQELIFHRLDKSSDNVVIIDKHKSDTLTLNSVSSETRLNARTNSIIERELRLQKSLSEECEDLGVDEPSTSDLFPDAFISF
ncbi:serine-rich adhesin for platelets-like [Sitodiplosis mosellana]|uniref:serine-rich adhesin for platelets-like n=1 Tax=Sitodiplosis mosellana TaxID=263140 RepID=UPI0024449FCF|nr:serine-rich adhesin for platelets-like [Sitodiplosis mosellana]